MMGRNRTIRLLLITMLLLLACAPKQLEPGSRCDLRNEPALNGSPLYKELFDDKQGPGAHGCLIAIWDGQEAPGWSTAVHLDPLGNVSTTDESGERSDSAIALPADSQGKNLVVHLVLLGPVYQSRGSKASNNGERASICKKLETTGTFSCSDQSGDACWLSMQLSLTTSGESQGKPQSCLISVNPKAEPPPPIPQPETQPEPQPEPPPLPELPVEPAPPAEPVPPTEPPPLPELPTEPTGPEDLPPEQPTEPPAPEDLPPELPTESPTPTEPPTPMDGGTPDRVPGCTPGNTIPCKSGMPGNCDAGTKHCDQNGQWGVCIVPARPEVCNNIDDDCDGVIDNQGACGTPPTSCAPLSAPCVVTIAGPSQNSTGNSGNIDGDWQKARFNTPYGLAIDAQGNIYIADTNNNKIRILTPNGYVGTYAGTGTRGTRNGPRLTATFNRPYGLAFGPGSQLYIADRSNKRLRYIETTGLVKQRSFAKVIEPIVLANAPTNSTLYMGDYKGKLIYHIQGTSTSSISGSYDTVVGLAVRNNTLYITEFNKNCIYAFDINNSNKTVFAGNCGVSGETDGHKLSALFNLPTSLTVDSQGNLYVYDQHNLRIRKIDTSGNVTTVTGSGLSPVTAGYVNGPAKSATFRDKATITAAPGDSIIIADLDNHAIRRLIFK